MPTWGSASISPSRFAETGRRLSAEFDKGFFETKLGELGALNDLARTVLARLGPRFTIMELETALHALDEDGVDRVLSVETSHILHWLASSNYRVEFPRET